MQRNLLNAKRKIYLLILLSRFSAGDFTLMLRHNAIDGPRLLCKVLVRVFLLTLIDNDDHDEVRPRKESRERS